MFLVLLAVILFACMGRRFSGRRPSRQGWARHDWSADRPRPSQAVKERFEEWHRHVHGDDVAAEPKIDPEDVEHV
jgi:hypothetical protein